MVPNPSGQIPSALNAAIKASRHSVVARVDGHCLLPPGYLRTAVRALEETGADNVGGVMAAAGVTPFQQAVAWAMTSPAGVGAAQFHTGGQAGPADTVYLGVYRRAAIEQVGGYDEAFAVAEDWEMNHRIRQAGGLIWFLPDLKVTYRPRDSIRALAVQYFRYGRWRRVVARQHAEHHQPALPGPACRGRGDHRGNTRGTGRGGRPGRRRYRLAGDRDRRAGRAAGVPGRDRGRRRRGGAWAAWPGWRPGSRPSWPLCTCAGGLAS